ncbi:MAG: hypothetical protein JNL21_39750 [Myxococcales bacterium]|jgi:hypothetical protein|nr:hypothetical protein [Myxococcales bacterium]
MSKLRKGTAAPEGRRETAAEKAIDDLLDDSWASVGQIPRRQAIRMARESAEVNRLRRRKPDSQR